MRLFSFLRSIERKAYPPCYRQLQDCHDMEDLISYCEALDPLDLIILTGENWYFLAVRSTKEIVDLACNGKMRLKDLFKIKNVLASEFNNQKVILDARDTTSYRLISRLGKVVSDNPYSWNGETFHEMEVYITH